MMPDGSTQPMAAFGPAGGFEGADNTSTKRGYIVFPQLDTRQEINTANRTEILRKSRWLYNNHGLAKRLIRGIARMVGYMAPKPATPDKEWNALAKRYYEAHRNSAAAFDRAGKYNFKSYQLNLNRLWLKDGDSVTLWVEGEAGQSQVKCFEGHQIGSDIMHRFSRPKSGGRQWNDGVLVGRDNEHQAYRVIHPDDPAKGQTIPANLAHMHTMFERPGQPRGIGCLHHAVNHMMDITEIVSDVKVGIKTANLLGFYLSSTDQDASLPGSKGIQQTLRMHKARERKADGTEGEDGDEKNDDYVPYEDVFESGMIPKLPGWEAKVLHDARPNQNQVELLRWLVREVSLGLDISPEVVWDIGALNGNTSRMLAEDTQEVLDTIRMETLVPFCQRDWFNCIGAAVARGDLPMPKIPKQLDGIVGFWSVDWIPPKRKTIDRGREGRLNIEERKTLLRTLDQHYSEQQQDWTVETGQFLDEIETILDMAETKGWSEDRIQKLENMLLAPVQGAAVLDSNGGDDGESKGKKSEK